MISAGVRILGAWTCAAVLGLAAGALAADRGEDLAGDTMPAHAQPAGPGWQEPAALPPAAGDRAKPLLKLPEVVVKGDRQFQVSAERRDWVLTDPMAGAKEVPADLASVVVPGISSDKDAPAAETITAKDHILTLEAAGGTPFRTEGRLLAGQELNHWNYLLRADYSAGAAPEAYGFAPFGQKGGAGLDLRTDAVPAADLTLSLSALGESVRQPRERLLGWGDWLERASRGIALQGDVDLWGKAVLKARASWLAFTLGTPRGDGWDLDARSGEVQLDYQQKIRNLVPGDFDLLASYGGKGQTVSQTVLGAELGSWEALRTLSVRARMNLLSLLHLEAGIRLDDFQGERGRSAAGVVGQASLLLPTRTVLYASASPELRWEPVADWNFRNPYPAVGGLPRPENVYANFRLGWRQNFGDNILCDAAWFKRDASDTPAWLDPARTGLFAYANLGESHEQGGQFDLEIHYLPNWYQTFGATVRDARAGAGQALPYAPRIEVKSEMKLTLNALELGCEYRYLGERASDPAETSPDLGGAHLLAGTADYDLAANWTAFCRLDNLLGASYQEWRGYPARGLTGVAGLRVNF